MNDTLPRRAQQQTALHQAILGFRGFHLISLLLRAGANPMTLNPEGTSLASFPFSFFRRFTFLFLFFSLMPGTRLILV